MTGAGETSTFIFAGGGTGGHIFPGIAISEQVRELVPNAASFFVCSKRPGDLAMLSPLNVETLAISAQPFSLRPRGLIRFMANWGTSVREVRGAIRKARAKGPVVLVALGGFVAAPAVQAAKVERCPVLMVNLDAVPGRANRWIARSASDVLTAAKIHGAGFDSWKSIRPIVRRAATAQKSAAECRAHFSLSPERSTLFVTGASLGAKSVNEFMTAFVAANAPMFVADGWQVIHQTGNGFDEQMRDAYAKAGVAAFVAPFIEDMGLAWGAADAAVSRAGAGSVAEAWCNRIPTLFMPYPHHSDQHQKFNAELLVTAQAAVLVDDLIDADRNMTRAGVELLRLIQDRDWRRSVKDELLKLPPPDGARAAATAAAALLRR
jgi:UDP-N-acetylglucosamine--N-acetylmuramyl-(pentapeptide) pyrophosphoryl-undecaprenol N-acetylglucosamine transferase